MACFHQRLNVNCSTLMTMKTRKWKMLFAWAAASVLATCPRATAQTIPLGDAVYLSAAEMENDAPAFRFDKEYRLREKFWHGSRIQINTPDSAFVLRTPHYWGYRMGGRLYRVSNSTKYTVVDHEADLWIYRINGSRGYAYFFSRTPDGPVRYLSRRALRRSFNDQPTFVSLLTAWPRTNIEAKSKDSKRLQVLDLYRHSLQKQV